MKRTIEATTDSPHERALSSAATPTSAAWAAAHVQTPLSAKREEEEAAAVALEGLLRIFYALHAPDKVDIGKVDPTKIAKSYALTQDKLNKRLCVPAKPSGKWMVRAKHVTHDAGSSHTAWT